MTNQRTGLALFKDSLIGILHAAVFLPVLHYGFQLNRVSGIESLVLFFLITQVLAVTFHKGWVFFAGQGMLTLSYLYYLFRDHSDSLWPVGWLRDSAALLREQLTLLIAGELSQTPQFLLMTLFFILITLLTYLSVHKHLAFPSFLIAFVYLLLVHTFSSNTILPEMIRLIGFGFLFISLMHMTTRTTAFHFVRTISLTAIITFALTSLSSWGIERGRPTQEWVEGHTQAYQRNLDEQGFFDWINDYTSGIGYRRTGMGFDDSELGGPLRQDYTSLFTAYTSTPHYWKVLHRTEYNGLGWASDEEEETTQTIAMPYNVLYDYTMSAEDRNLLRSSEDLSIIGIDWLDDLGYLVYPYGLYDLDSQSDSTYSIERYEDSALFSAELVEGELLEYSVSYDRNFPSRFDDDLLRADDGWRDYYNNAYREMMEEADDAHDDSVSGVDIWFENELQIPETLPQRVSELAHELTDGLSSEYEMVRAIEQYLKEDGGYRYSLLEVENTPDGGDYVDHFLFESKIGYCNNFSSAMAILLREVGIPTRWTKGFTPGSQYTDDNGETFFEISNANAHSWVEVFFPSYGWVPFEPSPSFANPMTNPEPVATVVGETYSFVEDDFIDLETEDLELDAEEDVSETPEAGEGSSVDDQLSESDGQPYGNGETPRSRSLLVNLFLVAALTLSVFIAIFRWRAATFLSKLALQKNLLTLHAASNLVLRLFNFRLKRRAGQTIENYLYQWKPFITDNTDDSRTIDRFISLADEAFYGPRSKNQKPTSEQQPILLNSLDLLLTLPDLKKNPRTPHPLSGKIQEKL